MPLTEAEIARILARKHRANPWSALKSKLRARYRGRIDDEIKRTARKLMALREIAEEESRGKA